MKVREKETRMCREGVRVSGSDDMLAHQRLDDIIVNTYSQFQKD